MSLMSSGARTLTEDEAIELIAYLLSSARGLLREPESYAVLRMATAADRLAALWAPRATGDLGRFLDDLVQRMPVAAATTQGGDVASFERYLGEKIGELARIVKQRQESKDGA